MRKKTTGNETKNIISLIKKIIRLTILQYKISSDIPWFTEQYFFWKRVADQCSGDFDEDIKRIRTISSGIEDLPWQSMVFTEIWKVTEDLEDLEAAIKAAFKIPNENLKDEILYGIAKNLLSAGNLDKARELSLKIRDPFLKLCLFADLFKISKNIGDFKKALSMLPKVKDLNSSVLTIADVVEYLLKLGS
ncbi:MAG TPA: hypothetical protein PLE40_00260 [Candidatus Pacearchaeota archaeon]|nr:hypothetical protein [Candidatus Pacearchaeota archaeon]